MHKIAILNQTSLIPGADLQNAVAALQIQLDRDFEPSWGIGAELRYITSPNQAAGEEWIVWVVDTVKDAPAGALAWHAKDSRGQPFAVIPVQVDLDNGVKYSAGDFSSISHELLEMLGDPNISMGNFCWLDGRDAWVALENCDPVEEDVYKITPPNGAAVWLSNFVWPAWFEPASPVGTPVDEMGTLHGPGTMSQGGYISYYQGGQWHDAPAARHKHDHSRHTRRRRRHAALTS